MRYDSKGEYTPIALSIAYRYIIICVGPFSVYMLFTSFPHFPAWINKVHFSIYIDQKSLIWASFL